MKIINLDLVVRATKGLPMTRNYRHVLAVLTAAGTVLLMGACAPQAAPPQTDTPSTASPLPEDNAPSADETSAPETTTPEPVVMVHTYNQTSEMKSAVEPEVFIPPRITGEGPGELEFHIDSWDNWGADETIGHGSVRITGGGGQPEVHDNVTLTLTGVSTENDESFYTVFGYSGTGYPYEERSMDFSKS